MLLGESDPPLRPPSIYSVWRKSVCQAPTPPVWEELGPFIVLRMQKVIIPLRPNGAQENVIEVLLVIGTAFYASVWGYPFHRCFLSPACGDAHWVQNILP